MGMKQAHTSQAHEMLRVLAVDYHVTAQMVDMITELFDESSDKVWTTCESARGLGNDCEPGLQRLRARVAKIAR